MRDSQREMMMSAEESHAQELEALKAEHAEELNREGFIAELTNREG